MVSEHVAGVLDHKKQVALLLHAISTELNRRAIEHDDSKFSPEELESYEAATPRFKHAVYASEEYKQICRDIKPAIDHHITTNRHHPEYFGDAGINGMNLVDLIEMTCDWIAASKRGKDGDIYKGLPINQERYGIGEQLYVILKNTIDALVERKPKPKEIPDPNTLYPDVLF